MSISFAVLQIDHRLAAHPRALVVRQGQSLMRAISNPFSGKSLRNFNLEKKREAFRSLILHGLTVVMALLFAQLTQASAGVNSCEAIFLNAENGHTAEHAVAAMSVGNLTRFDENSFTGIQMLANKRSYIATIGNRRVFFKVGRGSGSASAMREMQMQTALNSLSLGARLLGDAEVGGRVAIVSEVVEGSNTQFPMIAEDNVRLTKPIQAEMRRQVQLLYENHIWPMDLQFMVSEQGRVTLIDPELFQFDPQRSHDQREYEDMLNRIFSNWDLEDRLD